MTTNIDPAWGFDAKDEIEEDSLSIKQVNICGVPHKIIRTEDVFDTELHLGRIDYVDCVIKINSKLQGEAFFETLTHEILHGMLTHLGFHEESQNEQFVQALANAINQTFRIKETL